MYDYCDKDGVNEIAEWTRKLQKPQRIKLRLKFDMLAQHGPDLMPHTLTNTDERFIYKLRVQGNPKLRPLLCKGPLEESEFTILIGAKEVQWDFDPRDALEKAVTHRQVIIDNPERRCDHERIS